jgi:hypothetical protein
MYRFGKVVLSRKGFDSTAGGGFSPFDPKTRKYIVLPIPVGKKELEICNPLKYEEVHLQGNYLDGYPQTNLKSLMETMKKKATIKTKDGKEKSEYAHFDPWLGHCPWLAEGSSHQIGAFGQVGIPQAQLHNQGVGEGSLFLFFSRFTTIDKNGENKIVPGISRENLNKDLYFIYGWLKVKKVIREYKDIIDDKSLQSLKSLHPHATEQYFKNYPNNTIYIADELMFPDDTIPGCGYFPRLNTDLCLTASDSDQQKYGQWIPSRWKLPNFLREKCLSVLNKRFVPKGDLCLVETTGQWQEAVFDESEEEFYNWFRGLVVDCLQELIIPGL